MEIIEVNTRDPRQVKQFTGLPFRLYQQDPFWIPPLSFEERRVFDRRHFPFYRASDAAFFLAVQDGVPVGRIAALENCRYNEYNHEHRAFFYFFECIPDAEISSRLFDRAFDWARNRGLDVISGPKGFSALDSLGLLVRGFDHRPVFGMPYNPDYYPSLIEAAGFTKEGDILSGYMDGSTVFPDKIHQIAQRVQERRGLVVARFRTRGELKAMLPQLKAMYNGAIEGTPGNVPMTDEEVQAIASQMLWFANPRLIKIIQKDTRAVGFLFAYPDVSDAIRRCGGRIFPLGWFFLLRALKHSEWVILNGAGIIEEYRGMGGTALLFSEMQKSMLESDVKYIEVAQIGAENERMLRELKGIGIDFYKTYRIYQRKL